MINVLFSTTRQWNPGDEFILFGIRRIFDEIGITYNTFIFNRNPEINPPMTAFNALKKVDGRVKGEQYWKSFLRIGSADNSFKPGMDGRFIDLAVFAGTPSWCSRENLPMYEVIRDASLPTCYLGIGGFSARVTGKLIFPKKIQETLNRTLILTVRDRKALDLLEEYSPKYLPCPALLSSPDEKIIKKVNAIGLIYSTWRTHKSHCISQEAHQKMVRLYHTIHSLYGNKYRIAFVCHYIDEVPDIYATFGKNAEVYYSYDARDYLDIYRQFDIVIGARVHGIGISASLGIPGLHLGHDGRAGTVEGFRARNIDIEEWGDTKRLIAAIDALITTAPQQNAVLRDHKYHTMKTYCELLRSALRRYIDITDEKLHKPAYEIEID